MNAEIYESSIISVRGLVSSTHAKTTPDTTRKVSLEINNKKLPQTQGVSSEFWVGF